MKPRIIYWIVALAIIGAALGTKSAPIDFRDVFVGAIFGGALGASIGWLISKREEAKTKRVR